jgi:cytochrome c peroxidase
VGGAAGVLATFPARLGRASLMALLCQFPGIAGGTDARLGLPPVPSAPADAPSARTALGKLLFFDQRLSGDGSVSCASCHQRERAFSDGLAVAKGIGQRLGTRNTPSLLNVAFNQSQFWDGRRADLESQALDPLFDPREHGLRDPQALLAILSGEPAYVAAFRGAFPAETNPIDIERVAQALAGFERTLLAGNSPFDRYYFKGEKAALSPAAVRGLALFRHDAQCVACHSIGTPHAMFADDKFHSLGVGLRRLGPELARITLRLASANQRGASVDQTALTADEIAALGRFAVTFNPADIAKFRTPSLRNVALTAPYMHDGSVATLEQAVELELYYRSAQADRPLILTPLEKADLVEFLKSLTSPPNAH